MNSKQKRESYRNNKKELKRFIEKANEYLYTPTDNKSMSEFYEYMGITRYTLSKYNKRNRTWNSAIDKIKGKIDILKEFNFDCVIKGSNLDY